MPVMIGELQMSLWKFIGTLILSIIIMHWSVLLMPFIIVALLYYMNIYLQLQRKLKRIEKLTRSPIFQATEEIYAGARTIRSYGSEQTLIKRLYRILDDNLKCNFHIVGLECWGLLRVQFVTLLLNISTYALIVFFFNM